MGKLQDKYWAKVMDKGQGSKDTRTVSTCLCLFHSMNPKIDKHIISKLLSTQMCRDIRAGYRFYDALGMWLGQEEFWTGEDSAYLEALCERYLVEVTI